jgi:hypothetical protein
MIPTDFSEIPTGIEVFGLGSPADSVGAVRLGLFRMTPTSGTKNTVAWVGKACRPANRAGGPVNCPYQPANRSGVAVDGSYAVDLLEEL